MAEYTGINAGPLQVSHSGTYGNAHSVVGKHAPDSQNLAATDELRIAKVPGPATIVDVSAFFDAVSAATGTTDIGFKAADGSGFIDQAGTVADDPDYWAAAVVTNAAGSDRTAAKPLTIEKDIYVVLTQNTAAMDQAATEIFVKVDYMFQR